MGQVPYNKRIVTLEQGCREFDLTVTDEAGNVLNNVVHLVTRFSDDPKQNITLVKLLETTLTINPDCVAVAEMKGAESMQAINAANTGHGVHKYAQTRKLLILLDLRRLNKFSGGTKCGKH